jgi:hypothetical protein
MAVEDQAVGTVVLLKTDEKILRRISSSDLINLDALTASNSFALASALLAAFFLRSVLA